MRHGSLFSGIGGFDLAAQWMGWENVFQVEIDPFCQKVLEKNFPGVKRYGDIKEFDGTKYRGAIDVLSGGFPCQPFSLSGKREGNKDPRHLWPEMLRIIREVQPAYVVGENVYGIVNWSGGLVFEQVCVDLENEGYQVQPVILPACGVNAPHRRDRVWFIAAHTTGEGRWKDTEGGLGMDGDLLEKTGWHEGANLLNTRSKNHNRVNPDAFKIRREGGGKTGNENQESGEIKKRSNAFGAFFNCWEDFPSQPPLRDGDDGVSTWLVRSGTEAGGNAIVPQVAYEIFKAIDLIRKHQIEL